MYITYLDNTEAKKAKPKISKIESGERTLHAHEIFTYAKALGVTPYELLDAIENALK